jgi:hypothetical protein
VAAACTLAVLAGCTPEPERTGRAARTGPLAAHPVERLRERPAPLDSPESYRWTDRPRFRADLERHVADLYGQAIVLRNGLRNGAGPAPRETLIAIRAAEADVVAELGRVNAATAQNWSAIRIDVLAAVMRLGRAIERARRAASPARPSVTI